jgi:hypothetical protein
MHALEVCITDTRGAIYGVVITLSHLKETLRGRKKRDAVDVCGYEVWKSVQCTRTHTEYCILKMRVGDGEGDKK